MYRERADEVLAKIKDNVKYLFTLSIASSKFNCLNYYKTAKNLWLNGCHIGK